MVGGWCQFFSTELSTISVDCFEEHPYGRFIDAEKDCERTRGREANCLVILTKFHRGTSLEAFDLSPP